MLNLSHVKQFYWRYPSRGFGKKDIRWGDFENLVQYVAMGFSLENVDHLTKEADGIFVWSDRTMKMLEKTKMNGASIKTKKLVLIAYLFEIYYDLLLAPSANVSRSAGLESDLLESSMFRVLNYVHTCFIHEHGVSSSTCSPLGPCRQDAVHVLNHRIHHRYTINLRAQVFRLPITLPVDVAGVRPVGKEHERHAVKQESALEKCCLRKRICLPVR